MGTQSACLARWECVPQSPTSPACTACTAPVPAAAPLPLPAAPACWTSPLLVWRTHASLAGWFDGWLRVHCVLFWLLAWFLLSPAAFRRPPGLSLVSTTSLTSCAERSACPYACSCGSSCPASGKPRASAGGCP